MSIFPDGMLLNIGDVSTKPKVLAPAFNEWLSPTGETWTKFYRTASGYLLSFPGIADFSISADGLDVVAYPSDGAASASIEHVFLNQVWPLMLSRQSKLMLHASAVEIGEFSVAFVGESGRGKSTLAASFAVDGGRFLTDDGLYLENSGDGYVVKPSHPSIRLWEDSYKALLPKDTKTSLPIDYSTKSRFLAGDEIPFCDNERNLKFLYLLGDGDTEKISIEAVSGREAIVSLLNNTFLLDVEERQMLTSHFEQLTKMAQKSMFYQIDYPRDYSILPELRLRIKHHVETGYTE